MRAVFDLQPAPVDSDYELAFRTVASSKRALVIVFTDLIEEVAARSLVMAVPVLARRHEVVVAGVVDPDLDAALRTPPGARARRLPRGGRARRARRPRARRGARARRGRARARDRAGVARARPCVGAYLSAKARARL